MSNIQCGSPRPSAPSLLNDPGIPANDPLEASAYPDAVCANKFSSLAGSWNLTQAFPRVSSAPPRRSSSVVALRHLARSSSRSSDFATAPSTLAGSLEDCPASSCRADRLAFAPARFGQSAANKPKWQLNGSSGEAAELERERSNKRFRSTNASRAGVRPQAQHKSNNAPAASRSVRYSEKLAHSPLRQRFDDRGTRLDSADLHPAADARRAELRQGYAAFPPRAGDAAPVDTLRRDASGLPVYFSKRELEQHLQHLKSKLNPQNGGMLESQRSNTSLERVSVAAAECSPPTLQSVGAGSVRSGSTQAAAPSGELSAERFADRPLDRSPELAQKRPKTRHFETRQRYTPEALLECVDAAAESCAPTCQRTPHFSAEARLADAQGVVPQEAAARAAERDGSTSVSDLAAEGQPAADAARVPLSAAAAATRSPIEAAALDYQHGVTHTPPTKSFDDEGHSPAPSTAERSAESQRRSGYFGSPGAHVAAAVGSPSAQMAGVLLHTPLGLQPGDGETLSDKESAAQYALTQLADHYAQNLSAISWRPPKKLPRPEKQSKHFEKSDLVLVTIVRNSRKSRRSQASDHAAEKEFDDGHDASGVAAVRCMSCHCTTTSQWRIIINNLHCNACYAKLRRWTIKNNKNMHHARDVEEGFKSILI